MQTNETTLDGLMEMAVAKMPRFRRRVMQRRLNRPHIRQAVAEDLVVKLHDDPRAAAIGLPVAVFAGDNFTEETPFAIDVARLQEILDLILEYLPRIIELITVLFA